MKLLPYRSLVTMLIAAIFISTTSTVEAQKQVRHETRSGVLEFESNGYPTIETVKGLRNEVNYQRAVQAYIHFIPAVAIMQWRNAHHTLGGKPGDMIIYGTTESKMPILTANDTTTYILSFVELADTDGLLYYRVPAGPTGGTVNDLWQRTVTDTGMTGPDAGKGGLFLLALEGTEVPDDHGADFVVKSETSTLLIGTRILTPDPEEGKRILNAHEIYAPGKKSAIKIFDAPHANWKGHQARGMDFWKTVHQAVELNAPNERDMIVMQWLKNLGIERGKPYAPSDIQKEILEEAALVGETWAMGNSFAKPKPVKHWADDPKSQWQYILFMESPLDQMAKNHMEIDARSAYTYEAITVAVGNTKVIVDAGIQYLAAYKDDTGRWLEGSKTYELVVPPDVPILNFWSVVLYDYDTRCMIVNPQGKTEVNSRQEIVTSDDGSVRLVFSPRKPDGIPEANWIQTNPKKGFFAYFRWYSPTKPFFDRTWKMGNIKEVN